MTDTKDAAQVLRDAGWLVVEPDMYTISYNYTQYAIVEIQLPIKTPDTIDWSHVDPKYRYMARDEDGSVWLFERRPKLYYEKNEWDVEGLWGHAKLVGFASYRRGTVPWDKSLVCREDEE